MLIWAKRNLKGMGREWGCCKRMGKMSRIVEHKHIDISSLKNFQWKETTYARAERERVRDIKEKINRFWLYQFSSRLALSMNQNTYTWTSGYIVMSSETTMKLYCLQFDFVSFHFSFGIFSPVLLHAVSFIELLLKNWAEIESNREIEHECRINSIDYIEWENPTFYDHTRDRIEIITCSVVRQCVWTRAEISFPIQYQGLNTSSLCEIVSWIYYLLKPFVIALFPNKKSAMWLLANTCLFWQTINHLTLNSITVVSNVCDKL